MKIRLLESIASSLHGSHKPGEAQQLIAAGMAEAVKPAKASKVEKATSSKKIETATSD
mgnify:CR=1 FL=1